MIIDEQAYLAHYGVLRRSGRYPWGSGGPEYATNEGFLKYEEALRKEGMNEIDRAKMFGISSTELRAAKSVAKAQKKSDDIATAQKLRDKGMGYTAIGQQMDLGESSVRALLADGVKEKTENLQSIADMMERQVEANGIVDVGAGVENHLGISETKLRAAVAVMREKGYEYHTVQIDQLGTSAGSKTLVRVLAKPGMSYRDIVTDPSYPNNIKQLTEYSTDGGRKDGWLGIQPPISVNPKRVAVKYNEEGGGEADGVIYVRPGAKDLSLGQSRYAQVRVKVGEGHYLKGMAVYKDDLPDGVDLMFNTNKSDTGNKLDAMKKTKDDPDNPFGSLVRQLHDEKGNVNSAMNIVNEEGRWNDWSNTLSTQFLSKQSPALIRERLDDTFDRKKRELDEINALTNPVVKKKLLQEYSDSLDASSVHLKAAALPRTSNNVILPINSLKDSEVFAPNLPDGTRVALVRHPHGGTFEIPELTVNNKNPEARKIIGTNAPDAIGINHKVASRLSGADFDGDTVLVIPNDSGKVKSTAALERLKGFDTQREYPRYDGMKTMDGGRYNAKTKKVEFEEGKSSSPRGTAVQMGDISNLITDMTIKGANTEEIARAVRHSMVVIDAEKHVLDYKRSERDHGIRALKTKYQGGSTSGASTLISRAKSDDRTVAERRLRKASEGGAIDMKTGEKVYVETGRSWVGKNGETVVAKQSVRKLELTRDARTLSSGTVQEDLYANHSNRLKRMADEARLSMVKTKPGTSVPSAKVAYKTEVAELNAALNVARKNKPRERAAQIAANAVVQMKVADSPSMDKAEIKKLKYQALEEARTRAGASKTRVHITDSQWEAIQAGAISPTKLAAILDNADMERVRELATPRVNPVMDSARTARAKAMISNGYTQAEAAQLLGVPVSTLQGSLV